MSETEERSVIVDFGTGITKVGFSGDENPKEIFPTIFGKLKNAKDIELIKENRTFIGEQVRRQSGDFTIRHPIEHGIFTNYDDMEKLIHFTFFDEIRVNPKGRSVLFIEPPCNPRIVRNKQAEIMFEKYEVSNFCVRQSPLLILYSSGRNSGITVEIGEGVTSISPFYDGFSILRGEKRQNFGGFDLNEYLERLIQCEQGIAFNTSSDKLIVQDIKEKSCYVALDFESELQKSKNSSEFDSSYVFSDQNELKLSNERFRCPELLFKPRLNGFEFMGIHELFFDSIMKCDINTRADLCINVILSGGSTFFEGFKERLKNEICKLMPPKLRVNIIAPECRDICPWIGGSILTSLSTFPKMSVPREEYNENGKDLINLKCF